MPAELHAVTGALGFSGGYIARRLLAAGHRVMTLTQSHRPNPFGPAVAVHPFHFDQPEALADSLRGVNTLYNTYWIRFNHKTRRAFSHATAVQNTLTLFRAAKSAGVQRIVHTSITNPSLDSPLEYFRGKAQLEQALQQLGLSYAILRPAVLFGLEDILINNIAYLLRRFPFFLLFGRGDYRLQPIHVDDFAALAVAQGAQRDNVTVNAIGPDTMSYRGLVKTLARALGLHRPILPAPPIAPYLLARLLAPFLHDVPITRDEIKGLMAGLLCVPEAPPTGATSLAQWAAEHASTLGLHYASELARRQPVLPR